MSIEPSSNGLLRWIVPVAAIVAVGVGIFAILDRLDRDARQSQQQALRARAETLTASALQPGSPLACLDAIAGETTEAACEAQVFASPQSTAAAVAYTAARLTLLADAQRADPALAASFAGSRRALALDRFGIAAHVLALRDGCTADTCAAFAFLGETGALKANLKAQAFDQYVSRHADAWNAPTAPASGPAISQTQPAPAPKAASLAPASGEMVAQPIPDKYTLPSSASIPAVSIMNSEPPLPKGAADANATAPPATAPADSAVPVPPKRPQERPQAQTQQAPAPPAR